MTKIDLLTIGFIQTTIGGGKSYNQLLAISQSNKKQIIVVPSKELCDEHKRQLLAFNATLSIKVIHTDTSNSSTAATLVTECVTTASQIIITTKETFERALHRGLSNLHQYQLTIDEAINTHKAHYWKMFKSSYMHIKNYVDFVPVTSDHYVIQVKASLTKRQILQGIATNQTSHADVLLQSTEVRKFFDFVLSASHSTVISKSIIDGFEGINTSLEKESTLFATVSLLDAQVFNKFRKITILSSRFTETESYKALEAQGTKLVDLKPDAVMTNGRPNIYIHYAIDKNYTAAMRDNTETGKIWVNSVGKNIQQYFLEYAFSFIGDEEYIYCCNPEIDQHRFKGNGHMINTPHGLNGYQHIKYAIHVQSVLANQDEINALNSILGLTRADVDHERCVLNCTQFCGRTAIRDAHNTDDVHLFVMDKRRADDLLKTYPSATVIKADIPQIQALIDQNKTVRKQRSKKEGTIPKKARDCKSNFEKDWQDPTKQPKITKARINNYIDNMQQYYSNSELIINICRN